VASRIGKVAKKVGLAPSAIRYYEETPSLPSPSPCRSTAPVPPAAMMRAWACSVTTSRQGLMTKPLPS